MSTRFTTAERAWHAWIEPVGPETGSPEQIAAYETSVWPDSPYFRLLAWHPAGLETRTALDRAVFLGRPGIGRGERELAATVASRLNGCELCTSVHSRFTITFSKREDDVRRLLEEGVDTDLEPRWRAIADAAAARGYALTVVTASGRDAVADGFARLHDQGVDGAIVLNEATAFARSVEVPDGLALVVVDSPPDDRDGAQPVPDGGRYVVVQTDHAAGARAAVAHLLERGHATVWHLAGPTDSFAAAERERGWRAALAAAARAVPDPLRGDWTSASGFAAAARLPAEVTAVFAANDQMALGALRALAEAGRRVPEDVAVVGFDDVADAADYRPPLTTLRQDFDALGVAAVAALVSAIEGTRAAAVTLPPTLIPRAST